MKALAQILIAVACTSAVAWEKGDETKCPQRGTYQNGYGFRVAIPMGLRGCPNSPVGMTDHGVAIPLDSLGNRSIDVFGAYNAALFGSIREATDSSLDYLRNNTKYEHITVIRRIRTRLGGLEAERTIIGYRMRDSGVEMTSDSTEALRCVGKCQYGPSHTYAVTLTSPAATYPTDRKLLESLLQSWKKQPTNDGP